MQLPKVFCLCLLFLTLSLGLKAQSNYEYAVVTYAPFTAVVEISTNGTEYKKIQVDRKEIKGEADVNGALKEINSMAKKGWEVMNATTTHTGPNGSRTYFTFYLRRKTN